MKWVWGWVAEGVQKPKWTRWKRKGGQGNLRREDQERTPNPTQAPATPPCSSSLQPPICFSFWRKYKERALTCQCFCFLLQWPFSSLLGHISRSRWNITWPVKVSPCAPQLSAGCNFIITLISPRNSTWKAGPGFVHVSTGGAQQSSRHREEIHSVLSAGWVKGRTPRLWAAAPLRSHHNDQAVVTPAGLDPHLGADSGALLPVFPRQNFRPLATALMYLPGKEPGLQGRACRAQGCTSRDRQRRAQKGQRQLCVAKASKSNTHHETEQACLSFTISQRLLKLLSLESMMPSNHLILCHSLLLLPSIFPSIRVFFNESALHIRWPKYWRFSISPSNEYSGLISFQIDWFDLLAVKVTFKSFLQDLSLKASILLRSLWSNSHIRTWLLEKSQLWLYRPLLALAKWCLCFLICCLDLS